MELFDPLFLLGVCMGMIFGIMIGIIIAGIGRKSAAPAVKPPVVEKRIKAIRVEIKGQVTASGPPSIFLWKRPPGGPPKDN